MRTTGLSAQTAIIALGRLLNMAAAAGTLMVLARILPDKESYGAISQLILLYMVLSQIFAVGLPQSTFYFLPRYEHGERRGFLIQTIVLLTLSGLLMAGGFYFGADLVARALNSPVLGKLLRAFALYPLFMLPTMAVEGTLLHDKRPVTLVVFNALVRTSMFCALVIPVALHATLGRTVAVWVGGAAVMWLLALWLMLRTVRGLPFAWSKAMLREEWAFSGPLALGSLIALSGTYLDRFLVSHAFGAAAFGVYNNATLEIPTVTMITNATSVVLLTEFSRRTSAGEHDAMMSIWHRATIKSSVVAFASLGFLAFWSQETMRVFFSDRFADSGPVFSIYVWAIPAMVLALQPLFVSHGATKLFVVFSTLGLAAKLLLVIGLGQLFALRGMAMGAVLSRYLVIALGVHWYARWLTRVGWRRFLPWPKIAVVLALSLVAGAVSRAAMWLPHDRVPLIVVYGSGLLIFLALYGVGLYATKLIGYAIPARFLAMRKSHGTEVTA